MTAVRTEETTQHATEPKTSVPAAAPNPLQTTTIETDFSQYPHNQYARPNPDTGVVETTVIQLGLNQLTVPAIVELPEKHNPVLKKQEPYVFPGNK